MPAEAIEPKYLDRVKHNGPVASSRLVLALLVLGAIFGLASVAVQLGSLSGPLVWEKDLLQEALLAEALVDGTNPYASPLQSPYRVYPYPPAHPPTTGILFLPFLPLGYEMGAVAWFATEILCLIFAVALVFRSQGHRASPRHVLAVSACLLGWFPIRSDLYWGQLALVQLPILIGGWWALNHGQGRLSGALVGVCIVIKPFLWPVALLYAIRRDWGAVLSLTVTFAAGFFLTAIRVGLDSYVDFFRRVLPAIDTAFRAYPENISLWTIGWRLFDGTGSPTVATASAPPILWASPTYAAIISAGIPAVFLGVGLIAMSRLRDTGLAFGLAVCISILVSPVAWAHYLVLAIIPVVELGKALLRARLPRWPTMFALAVAATLILPTEGWKVLAYLVADELPFAGHSASTLAATAAGGPALAACLLTLMLAYIGLSGDKRNV